MTHKVPGDESSFWGAALGGVSWVAVVPARVLWSVPVPGISWIPEEALLLFWESAGVLAVLGLFGVIG